jgi:two-component system sensor histidine kinase PhoQ
MKATPVADPSSGAASGPLEQARPFSLRLRMAIGATVLLALALGLVGMALAVANHRSAVSALQARMESYVYLVLAATEVDQIGNLHIGADLGDPRLSQPGSGIYVHVHGANAHWSSPSSLGLRLPELQTVAAAQRVFSAPDAAVDFYVYQYGVAWQLSDQGVLPFTVSVLVDPAEIEHQTDAFRQGLWRALGTTGLILLAAQVLLIYLGFRPLQKVARDVALVESGQSPQLQGLYPRELEPLARNVNQLLVTEKANQQRYRHALDSLAHSLKTPLAILRAGLEVDSPGSREAMRKAADEMHQLVATRLQRAALSARRTMARPVELAPEAERVLAGMQKIHAHKMIVADAVIPQGLAFFGERRDLLEIIGNLLDNAFKYGRGRVRLAAGPLNPGAHRPGLWLRVEDDGPGIDAADWPLLLQRGVRGDERVEGHGLGLAIVLELVNAYHGRIDIGHSDLGGAMIYLEFPGS